MTDGMVKAAVDKLEELALQELRLQWAVGKKVRELRDDLDWLRAFLGHADQRRRQQVNEYIELWVRQTREVAFDAEDLLEEYFHRGGLNCHGVLDLPSLLAWLRRSATGLFVRRSICDDIDAIMKRLSDIKDKRTEHDLHNVPATWAPPQRHYSQWSTLLELGYEDEVQNLLVAMKDPYQKILNFLQKKEKQRTVIAITGKSGIGKTTVAKWVSKKNFIRDKFSVIIWVDVPQKFKMVELLNNIIKQATGATEENIAMDSSEEEIKRRLIEKLSGRRYLIILDNVRTLEEWKFFLAVLPDEGIYRNRVVITTQIKPTGSFSTTDKEGEDNSSSEKKKDEEKYENSCLCQYNLEMKKLSREHGKELFCKRVFGETDFPKDFWSSEEHAKNMNKMLHGLPQSITLLAGLLRSKRKNEWPIVVSQLMHFSDEISLHETLSANNEQHEQQQEQPIESQQQLLQQREKQEEQEHHQEEEQDKHKRKRERQQQTPSMQYKQLPLMDKILMLSFDDLPPHLKQCFLYFSAFNAEIGINCQKLIQLWIAEGFVQAINEGSTMEECGQEYLKKLVSRCLINLVEKDYNNNIVTINIHENVLAFARSEAFETNFLQVHIQNSANNIANTSIRRLSLQSTFDPHKGLNLSAPKLRSLLCDFLEANTYRTHKETPPGCLCNGGRGLLKMATELIIGGHGEEFTIYRCKFLRVIDLKGMSHRDSLPREFGWLIHLRYLGLAQTSLRSLPSSIRKLHNLQTLDITKTNIKEIPRGFWKIQTLRHVLAQNLNNGPDNIHALCNLQSLHGVPWGQWAKQGIKTKRLANLRSLHLKLPSDREDHNRAPLMDALCSLENLTSLELEGSRLPLDGLLTTLSIHRLQYLSLHGTATAERHAVPRSSHGYLLPNLTKLSLCKTRITQAQLDAVAKLPNLAVLMLEEASYIEEGMVIPDGSFPELIDLQLKRLCELKTWEVAAGTSSRSTLKKLEKISIFNCEALTNVLEHLKTLQQLVLLGIYNCPLCRIPNKNEFVNKYKLLVDVYPKQATGTV